MTIDIVVYPQLSPRIVEILAETDVTVQNLVNAIRYWEDSDNGVSYKALIDAAGKEALGGDVTVGITATLQNTQIMFTGRTIPLDDGSGRTCDSTDSTGMHLYVEDADFVAAGVYPGATVYNTSTREMAAITEVTDSTNLQHFVLSGGAGEGWTSGDSYLIYPNVRCSISGGNLVAVDSLGSPIDPVLQAPNVQVVRSSSSSATLQEFGLVQEIVDGVWEEPVDEHGEEGTFGEGVEVAAAQASSAVYTTIDGCTPLILKTNLVQEDGFYNNMSLQIENTVGTVVRKIEEYRQEGGTFYLDKAIPFTPEAGDKILVLSGYARTAGAGR